MKNKQISKLNEYHMPRISSKNKRATSVAERGSDGSDEERSVKSGRTGTEEKKFDRLHTDLGKIEQKLRTAEDADR